MDYIFKTEEDLVGAGFALTPQIFNDGKGAGKIYEKVEDGMRIYFSVAGNGEVAEYNSNAGVTEKTEDVSVTETPVEELEVLTEVESPKEEEVVSTPVETASEAPVEAETEISE